MLLTSLFHVLNFLFIHYYHLLIFVIEPPIQVVARSKAYVYGRSLAGIVGSNVTVGQGCLSVVSVVCCQVEVSAAD